LVHLQLNGCAVLFLFVFFFILQKVFFLCYLLIRVFEIKKKIKKSESLTVKFIGHNL